ncbi:MAG: hypothetical protein E7Z79_04330 [Methanobrevibacter thaueri]|uniref:Uncharacterized protein n=1 Tax=Methanobrevibacter thaueri TaxID=190975 RepID=A0A8T3V9V6_9EURY|nr:DUF5750 family protein [Methanobrevibacter thaueri]MBE6501649.1 hypothetical protein [Methanobrevibacter thaueri]
MIVSISDYGDDDNGKFIRYSVSGLSESQLDYLKANLDEELAVNDDVLTLTMHFSEELYPFQSDVAKIRLDDFIAREEIEMNVFLSSFLEDM